MALKHLCDQSDESVVEEFIENPYDGHTLKTAYAQVSKITGIEPVDVFVDKGYKGSDHHPKGANVYIFGKTAQRNFKETASEKIGDRACDRTHETEITGWDEII